MQRAEGIKAISPRIVAASSGREREFQEKNSKIQTAEKMTLQYPTPLPLLKHTDRIQVGDKASAVSPSSG